MFSSHRSTFPILFALTTHTSHKTYQPSLSLSLSLPLSLSLSATYEQICEDFTRSRVLLSFDFKSMTPSCDVMCIWLKMDP
ncbi:hypothetical protein Hanom_Chr16g01461111 [Helianthus anomalus]